MTVATSRTIDNAKDTTRKIPSTSLSPRVLTSLEGVVAETLTGPGIGGTVELSHPAAASPTLILVHAGLGAFAPGGAAPAALPIPVIPTHFTFALRNVNGKAALTEVNGRNYSTSTLVVLYKIDEPDETLGGQSSVSP